jgi:hypothetical protein
LAGKQSAAVWLLLVGGAAAGAAGAAAGLVSDGSGAYLQLAPVFVGVALGVAGVRTFRSRSRRGRG